MFKKGMFWKIPEIPWTSVSLSLSETANPCWEGSCFLFFCLLSITLDPDVVYLSDTVFEGFCHFSDEETRLCVWLCGDAICLAVTVVRQGECFQEIAIL